MRIHGIEIDEAGIAMIYLDAPRPGLSIRQYELVPGKIIADVDKDGRIVAIEILDPKITQRYFGSTPDAIVEKYNIPVESGCD